ncbi:MAG: hypothetical protein M3Q39_08100 [Actinomycetota bacterium]|nr:hypothetical protein [Actinomycetota bacterium]
MVELGHAVQAIHLSARAEGLGAYHCPSINDTEVHLGLAVDVGKGQFVASHSQL